MNGPLAELLRILVDNAGTLRNFLWLNLNQQPDGAVSVGLADREFIVPGLASEVEVDGQLHVQILDLTKTRTERELTNPHFTFHPPNRLHLRADRENYLAEQLVMMDLQLPHDGRVPWLTFISRRVDQLPAYGGSASHRRGRAVILHPSSADISIAFDIDFIDSVERQHERTGELLDQIERWPSLNPQSMVSDWFLHLTARHAAARESATFTWHQQT